MTYYIGIDVGGGTVKYVLFNENEDVLDERFKPTRSELGSDRVIANMIETIETILSEKKIDVSKVSGIGIGIPGPVLKRSFVPTCVNLGWRNVDLGKKMKEAFPDQTILVENDANLAALGEQWKGAGKDVNSLVLITLGTGIGGGVVVDGKIISGAHGAGGEIGHMSVMDDPIDRVCGCGKRDCAELLVSATGIIQRAKEALEETDQPSTLRHYNGTFDARAIFMAAENGDVISNEIVEETGFILGRFIAMVGTVVDPELFLLGGGVAGAGDMLLRPTIASYREHCFSSGIDTPIRLASLGNQAGRYGAAKLVWE